MMRCKSWILDAEMLMLAESLQIRVVEVPTGWKSGKQHE